jgi:hypothetical protein
MKKNNTKAKEQTEKIFDPKEAKGFSLKEVRPGAVYLYYFARERDEKTNEILPSSVVEVDERGNKKYAAWYQEKIDEIIRKHDLKQKHLPKSQRVEMTEEEAKKEITNRVKWKWISAGRWNARGETKTDKEEANLNFLNSVKKHMPQDVIDRFLQESFEFDIIFEYDKERAQMIADKPEYKDIKNQFGLEMKKIKVEVDKRIKDVMTQKCVGKDKAREIVKEERYKEACQHNKEVKRLMEQGKTQDEALAILYNNTIKDYRING